MLLKPLTMLSALMRATMAPVALGVVGLAAWFGMETFYPLLSLRHELRDKNQQIEQMSTELEAKSREIQRMDTAMRLLKVDHRVARIAVADQWTRPDNVVMTKLAFAEVNDGGALLEGFKTFTIEGDVVYIDSWVAKFADEHVENGVPLRSTSICLFRRLFGENQTPNEGFALDTVGSRPAAYSPGTELSPLEKEIWANFWQYANDPRKAQSVGLRPLQGEAPSIRLVAGKDYWVFLRSFRWPDDQGNQQPSSSHRDARYLQRPTDDSPDHRRCPPGPLGVSAVVRSLLSAVTQTALMVDYVPAMELELCGPPPPLRRRRARKITS